MTDDLAELPELLTQTPPEYRRGLQEIIGAPPGDAPAQLCQHLRALWTSAGAPPASPGDYKQLVTDIADQVHVDWNIVLEGTAWADLATARIEAAIVSHVEADKMYTEKASTQSRDAIAALDAAFEALSSDWRKLLAAVIYVHQVIRPSVQAAQRAQRAKSGRTGAEPLHADAVPLGPTLLDIWKWSASDLASAALRGVIAEYLVSFALGLKAPVRAGGDEAQIALPPSGLKIEVASAAYLEDGFFCEDGAIRFSLRRAGRRDGKANVFAVDLKRRADIHVFCLLVHTDEATVDPLDVAQWDFYVVKSSVLDARFPLGQSIGLESLQALDVSPVTYEDLAASIEQYVPRPTARGRS
jgi:hypothetical protein